MASFSVYVSPGQIVYELRDDDEEMGEVIALIAKQVEKLDSDGAEVLRDYIRSYAKPEDLRVLASHLVQVANEMEA